jgi:glycosyltransferase involved in cell wall biosynthesis
MVGEASRPERYYGVIDVAVNAYRGAESFGLSVVEAMLCGKPVLAHALGGPAETVLDGVTGWHIREPTVEALRGGVIRALADRSRWATLGAAGRSRAMSEYTLEKQASFYARFAREVVGRGRPSVRQAG